MELLGFEPRLAALEAAVLARLYDSSVYRRGRGVLFKAVAIKFK